MAALSQRILSADDDDDSLLDEESPTRERPRVKDWLGQAILVLLFSVSAHAAKNALAPAQPALQDMGLDPFVYSIIASVPLLGSILLPTVWGVAYADFEQAVLIAVPLGMLVGQLLIALGLWLLEDETIPLLVAGMLLFLGLIIFSAFHGGSHVIQCAALSRVLPYGEASGFTATIGFTSFVTAMCNFVVPPVMQRHGILGVQLVLLIPGVISVAAGWRLSSLADQFAVPHCTTKDCRNLDKLAARSRTVMFTSGMREVPNFVRRGSIEWQQEWEMVNKKKSKKSCFEGMGVIMVLSFWKALIMGTLHSFRTIKNGMVVSLGASKVEAGNIIGTNQTITLFLLPFIGVVSQCVGRRVLLVLFSWLVAIAAIILAIGNSLPKAAWVSALFTISLTSLVVPVVGLSLVKGNTERSAGRSYGMLESIFSLFQVIFTISLGTLRQSGGFEYAMDFVIVSLVIGALTSLWVAYVVQDDSTGRSSSHVSVARGH